MNNKLKIEEFRNYYKDFKSINTINNYVSYLNNLLQILNQIEKYKNLSELEKIKKFAQENKEFQKYFNKFHNYSDPKTFSNFGNAARKYIKFIEQINNENFDKKEILTEEKNMQKKSLNQILYGPPGTGKTYSVIKRALEIIALKDEKLREFLENNPNREELKEKFEKYRKNRQIEFVTFHQSFSYEEFVEGLKPDLESEDIRYKIVDGIFKNICNKAKENYENSLKEEIFDFNDIDYRRFFKIGDEFKTLSKGKIFKIIDIDKKFIQIENSNGKKYPLRNQEILKYLKDKDFGNTKEHYSYEPVIAKYIYESLKKINQKQPLKNFILIIDEINRGNISKIFGELITLIEEDKRIGAKEEIKLRLPYSKEEFGVPKNLYIIGTMNTADRSIALMDTALRRRFEFVEMMPEYDDLPTVDDIDLYKMLKVINERIEFLYDRDHTIGHAYFIGIETFEELKEVFKNKTIPLLQEYFYDDWEKIDLVLNKNGFVKEKEISKNLFPSDFEEYEDKKVYEINEEAFEMIENYKKIYE